MKTGAQIEAKVLDSSGLTKQIDHKGLTWLDQTINDGSWATVKNEGFGAAVRVAIVGRVEWLKSKGLARDAPGKGVCADAELHTKLRAMEREHVLDSLWNKHGRTARFAVARDEIAGVYIDKVHSTEGTFAVFQDGRGLSLSPWRPELDVARGHSYLGRTPRRDWTLASARRRRCRRRSSWILGGTWGEKSLCKSFGMTRR